MVKGLLVCSHALNRKTGLQEEKIATPSKTGIFSVKSSCPFFLLPP